jgi:hypothetical protein
MTFVREINKIELTGDSVSMTVEGIPDSISMGYAWFRVHEPKAGDYLTQCNNGFYSVCPKNAFNAIRQVYFI